MLLLVNGISAVKIVRTQKILGRRPRAAAVLVVMSPVAKCVRRIALDHGFFILYFECWWLHLHPSLRFYTCLVSA